MDYKEKYEQAMLRMNKWVEGSEITDPKEVAEFVFPKLKESEDEKIRRGLIAKLSQDKELHHKAIAWLKTQGEQKSTLSEEDYNEIGVIACHLDNMGNEAMANSLLCIRDKYNNVKPKHAWSEEDEEKIELLITIFKVNHPNEYFKANPINTLNMKAVSTEEIVDWLKSLKQRMKGE